jgi:prefoldin subunit 5
MKTVSEKKYNDLMNERNKVNANYTDLVQKYMKLQNELEEAKKQVAGWSTMAGMRK